MVFADGASPLHRSSWRLVRCALRPRQAETHIRGRPVIDDVLAASFTLSASGTALYSATAGGRALSELVWVSRDGAAVAVDSAWRADFLYPALSPDGNTIAV